MSKQARKIKALRAKAARTDNEFERIAYNEKADLLEKKAQVSAEIRTPNGLTFTDGRNFVVKKWDKVVGWVYFDKYGEPVNAVAVAGPGCFSDPDDEVRDKYQEVVTSLNEQTLSVRGGSGSVRWFGVTDWRYFFVKTKDDNGKEKWVIKSELHAAAYAAWKAQRLVDYAATRKQSNGIDCFDVAVQGKESLVFKQENESGKLVRFWISKDANVSARIRYVNTPSHPASWRLEVYHNTRTGTRWSGNKVAEHYVHRTVTDEGELTVAKWVSIYFARFAPKPPTQEEQDEKLLASAWKQATVFA